MNDIEIPMTLPLDTDGFLRRECPHCERQFKWHHGPANEEAEQHQDPPAYHCPLCGEPADNDSWWTREQLDYAEGAMAPVAMQAIADELGKAFKGMKGITYKPGRVDVPDTPMPLTEPDEMVIVTSPCHAYEPVKVPDDHPDVLHCLVCGSQFAV